MEGGGQPFVKIEESIRLKYVFLGEKSVGKTSIVTQFCRGLFQEDTNPTIGVAYSTKSIQISDVEVKLQLWDASGNERYRAVKQAHAKNAPAIFIVYDVTKRDTFDSLRTQIEEAIEIDSDLLQIFLIANKADREENRVVSTQEGESFAAQNGLQFYEVSAKNGEQISQILYSATAHILHLQQRKASTRIENETNTTLPESRIKVCNNYTFQGSIAIGLIIGIFLYPIIKQLKK